ncbi:hypothetical protein HY493_03240 [Candidatus Woesearchaeota archaeon]|nr:hypothetical protein [Candidatus Woesearchaeota archaeon]
MGKIHVWEAVATLTGTIIGAGVLGIPYVMAQAGFLTGILVLALLGGVILTVNLCVGEITLRTKEKHQLTGYVATYLGPGGRWTMTVAMVVANYGALMAYLIAEGSSLAALFGGDPWLWSAGFFIVGSLIIYRGLVAVGVSELVLSTAKFTAFFTVVLLALFSNVFTAEHLAGFDITKLFVPYGVMLFAFLGAIAIPEMRQELSKHPRDLKKSIILGSVIPLLVYAVFGLAIVGVTGLGTTEIANVGIGRALGLPALIAANLFAILSMATAFIAIALGLKQMYELDYHFRPIFAFGATMLLPPLLILAGIHSFIMILGVSGAVAGGLEGILLVMTYWKARTRGNRMPEYKLRLPVPALVLLIAVFALGAVLTMRGLLV